MCTTGRVNKYRAVPSCPLSSLDGPTVKGPGEGGGGGGGGATVLETATWIDQHQPWYYAYTDIPCSEALTHRDLHAMISYSASGLG